MMEILPEVVYKGNDDYLTISYDNVIPVLVNATKEQQSQIEELKIRKSGIKTNDPRPQKGNRST